MARKLIFTSIKKELTPKNTLNLNLSRGDDLSAVTYFLKFDINHTNAQAIATDDYSFLANLVKNINLEIGAGQKVIDLPIRDILLIQLVTRGYLSLDIKKDSGAKVSTVRVAIDLALFGFINPKDTLLKTWKYGHRVINIDGGDFDKIEHCTINQVNVSVEEHFKKGAKPVLIDIGGGKSEEISLIKKPIVKSKAIVGTEPVVIDFPSKKKTTGIILYAVDNAGNIVEGCITDVKIQNAEQNILGSRTLEDINSLNRENKMLQTPTNSRFNNVAFIDLAEGQLSEAPDTSNINEEDTALHLNVTLNGKTSPNVRAIFLTVDKA